MVASSNRTIMVHAPPKTCRVKHSTQMLACINIGRAQMRGTYDHEKDYRPALIVLSLAGCAMNGDRGEAYPQTRGSGSEEMLAP
jgi:hypothetical protein